jgi:hypothetical protein
VPPAAQSFLPNRETNQHAEPAAASTGAAGVSNVFLLNFLTKEKSDLFIELNALRNKYFGYKTIKGVDG